MPCTWQTVLEGTGEIDLEWHRIEAGGPYFERVRRDFFEQHDGATRLEIPVGYSFRQAGQSPSRT